MERSSRLSAGFARVCDAPTTFRVSLRTPRATRNIHTHGPWETRFHPKISAVSLSHGVRVIRGLLSLFRSHPPRVGFGVGKLKQKNTGLNCPCERPYSKPFSVLQMAKVALPQRYTDLTSLSVPLIGRNPLRKVNRGGARTPKATPSKLRTHGCSRVITCWECAPLTFNVTQAP